MQKKVKELVSVLALAPNVMMHKKGQLFYEDEIKVNLINRIKKRSNILIADHTLERNEI